MNIDEIIKSLTTEFNKPLPMEQKRKIVFWYDGEQKFTDSIEDIRIDGVKIITMDKNYFYIKSLLEIEDTESNYLIYSPNFKPKSEENCLLDILLCNTEFSPNSITLIMKNIGAKEELRQVVSKYEKFFANSKREQAFNNLQIEELTEENIDLGVIAVLVGSNSYELNDSLKLLVKDKAENKKLEQIFKFGDLPTLCKYINSEFGVGIEDNTIINELFKMVVFTHLTDSVDKDFLEPYQKLISSKKINSFVFANHLMNDIQFSNFYDKYALEVENEYNIEKNFETVPSDKYMLASTFQVFDKLHIKELLNKLKTELNTYSDFLQLIETRKKLHFYKYYKNEYEAIYWAIKLFAKYSEIENYIRSKKAYDMIELYTKEFYFVDTFYRKFYFHFDQIKEKDIFVELKEKVENLYVNKYLNDLSVKWSETVESELCEDYRIVGVTRQDEFFNKYVKSNYEKDIRTVVIISDAFRYECANELVERLNQEMNGNGTLEYMQGLIPSYTKLGMASLLPHKELRLADNKTDVLVDGMKSVGTEDRNNILINSLGESALAIQYEKLAEIKKSDWKNVFSGKKVIYIYHNEVDAMGDNSSTEDGIYNAVESSIVNIMQLVKDLVNRVSAINILVTADHGFIYRRGNLIQAEKVSRNENNDIQKTRYALSKEKDNSDGILSISMKYLLGEGSGYVNVPKGNLVYSKQGTGIKYAHGGAMLQEITVPVVVFKGVQGKNNIKKVGVKYSGITSKITNPIVYLEFLQTEKVESKSGILRVKAYFTDENNNVISNENLMILDSTSDNIDGRRNKEKFVLRNLEYDSKKKYYLILEDDDTREQLDRIPFIIDIAIANDFDL